MNGADKTGGGTESEESPTMENCAVPFHKCDTEASDGGAQHTQNKRSRGDEKDCDHDGQRPGKMSLPSIAAAETNLIRHIEKEKQGMGDHQLPTSRLGLRSERETRNRPSEQETYISKLGSHQIGQLCGANPSILHTMGGSGQNQFPAVLQGQVHLHQRAQMQMRIGQFMSQQQQKSQKEQQQLQLQQLQLQLELQQQQQIQLQLQLQMQQQQQQNQQQQQQQQQHQQLQLQLQLQQQHSQQQEQQRQQQKKLEEQGKIHLHSATNLQLQSFLDTMQQQHGAPSCLVPAADAKRAAQDIDFASDSGKHRCLGYENSFDLPKSPAKIPTSGSVAGLPKTTGVDPTTHQLQMAQHGGIPPRISESNTPNFGLHNNVLIAQRPIDGSLISPFLVQLNREQFDSSKQSPVDPFARSLYVPKSAGTSLELSCDAEQLSEYQILVRKQLEIFVAQQEDVESNTQGRKKQVSLGQVGIRCRHCRDLPLRQRGKGAIYYPTKLKGVYQAAQNMACSHLCESCRCIPSSLRQELRRLRERRDTACGGKQYWADGARAMGLYEVEGGLRLRGDTNP